MNMNSALALDIETTGLDPQIHSIVAVGITTSDGCKAFLGNEVEILRSTEELVRELADGSFIITWNGEEFDLPFLRRRFDVLNVPSELALSPLGLVGKYGKPLYDARWGPHRHIDIAPLFRLTAEHLGVTWSLKPVARALLDLDPVEVDNTGESIAQLDTGTLRDYVVSDARITFALASHLNNEGRLSTDSSGVSGSPRATGGGS